MGGVEIAAAIAGFFVVLISGGSFAFVIHRNGIEKAHLSGMYEQKVTDLSNSFDEFKKEVRTDISGLRTEVAYCRSAIDGKKPDTAGT